MTVAIDGGGALPGFNDPVFDSQSVFRAVLEAMSRPGSVIDLPAGPDAPAPLLPSAAAVCLSLVDVDTALWLDAPLSRSEQVKTLLRFHCGCPLTDAPDQAAFAIVSEPAQRPALADFAQGSHDYPDRSTTLILQVAGLHNDKGVTLRGPGIEDNQLLNVEGLLPGFWEEARANHARFPCGVDIVFAAPGRLAALPRSTTVEN